MHLPVRCQQYKDFIGLVFSLFGIMLWLGRKNRRSEISHFLNFFVFFMSYNFIAMSSSDDNEYGFFSNCCLRIFIAQMINLFISLSLMQIETT